MGEDPSNAAHTELFRHSLKHGAGVGGMSVRDREICIHKTNNSRSKQVPYLDVFLARIFEKLDPFD